MNGKHTVVSGDTLWSIAEKTYGDGRLYPVISVVNHLADPDAIAVGQELLLPYVTYRHLVAAGDTKTALAATYYNDVDMIGVIEIANHAAQRNLHVGEWLLIPELADVGHHTLAPGETLPELAERWYGEANLWPIISIANRLPDDVPPGTVLMQPGLNRRHTVVPGDTLWALSEAHYGAGDLATKIALVAAANFIEDPDQIDVGLVIFFPSVGL